jgi:hypothetical protein
MIQRIESYRHKNYKFNWRHSCKSLLKLTAYYRGKRMRAEGYVHIDVHHAELIYNGINNALYIYPSSVERRRHVVEDLLVALHRIRLDKHVSGKCRRYAII